MQVKLLKDLVEEMAGVDSSGIVDILFNKKDVNEFLIAKKMDMTINQIRNILYKLSAEGLVSFSRKKDKRKGWYIYYWTLDAEKSLVKIEHSLISRIENLKHVLKSRETKRFYICNSCNIEVAEETALEHDFSCEECADVYTLSDNDPKIRELKGKITKKTKELEVIQTQIEEIREKARKKKERENKKLKKEEEKEKARKKAARKKAAPKKKPVKKKAAKKSAKKKAVKKSTKKTVKKKTAAKKKPVKKKPVKKKAAKKKR